MTLAQPLYCVKPLTLSSTENWYPYIYIDDNKVSVGADLALLKKTLNDIGCELEVIHFPERRSLLEINKGNFDIGLGASMNSERLKKYWYSDSYRYEVNRFVYRTDDQKISKADSLSDLIALNKVIAINLAGWYGEELEKAKAEHNNFIYSDTVSKRLKMLGFSRVDVVVDDDVVLCSELTRSAYNFFKIHPMILYQTPVYFIFNKQTISAEFVDHFNQALQLNKASSALITYYHHHIPSECLQYLHFEK